jgi:zinc finger SWIM domain-containing protein 3
MTSTQRSEGMNNVFKKRFRRKLGLSELLVECDKVCASLRANEVDADFQSRRKSQITYSPHLPMLKTAAESYTSRMYSEFEAELKEQFVLTGQLLKAEGSKLTYKVMHMQSDHGATVVFNITDLTISCSCRKYECVGILCKHALKFFNINDVFVLPPQYILK